MHSAQPAPTADDLRHIAGGDLRDILVAMATSWDSNSTDGSRWPRLAAELHALALTLQADTHRLSAAMREHAQTHPHGMLPQEPRAVPVVAHSSQQLHEMIIYADHEPAALCEAILSRHARQLAGPPPHTVELVPAIPEQACVAIFRDEPRRTVLVAYYGISDADMHDDLRRRGITGVNVGYVPWPQDTWVTLDTVDGLRIYDSFGAPPPHP